MLRDTYKRADFKAQITNEEHFKKLIDVRIKEAKRFEFYRTQLQKFIRLFSEFSHINIRSIKEQIDYLDRLPELELAIILNKVCKTVDFKNGMNTPNLSDYDPVIIYFDGVQTRFLSIIQKINDLKWKYCVVFKDYFSEASQKLLNESSKKGEYASDLALLVEDTWDMAYARWKEISVQIENGSIKLITLDLFADKYFGLDLDKFRDEFIYINSYFKIQGLNQRNEQIILYNKFKMSYSVAIEIDQVHIKLKLLKKFTELDDLLSIKSDSFKSWDLDKMDTRISKTVAVLDKFNDRDKLDCLKAYTESMNLVEWLRKNAPSLQELKFLVELASMSTGTSNDSSLDKTVFAKTLKEAGTAFAALIYDLKPDVAFYDFMTLCEQVCSHLGSDRHIAAKLLGVKDKVDLVEEIKKKKGNVELSSLEAAKDINQRGVYKISLKQDDSRVVEDSKNPLNIAELVSLEIKGTNLVYKYDQLVELQNILMLIAPRRSKIEQAAADAMDVQEAAKEEDESQTLEYFIEMFSSVTRLVEICIKLVQNGCLFFSSFNVSIHSDILNQMNEGICNNNRQTVLEIGLFNNNISIKETKMSTLEAIGCLCRLMEHTLESWSGFISNMRDTYLALNYFSLNQIKYLLVNLNTLMTENMLTSRDFENVLTILAILDTDLNHTKIVQACKMPVKDLDSEDTVSM